MKRTTQIKVKKGRGKRAEVVPVSELKSRPRPGAVALPGITQSRETPAIATKGAGKGKGAELREPRYDLLNELDEYLYPEDEEHDTNRSRRKREPTKKFDAVCKVRKVPSITMAVRESVYAQEVSADQRRRYPMAGLDDYLTYNGLLDIQGDPDVGGYRDARLNAITDAYADPSAKVALRGWMAKCSYVAPAAHGGTEDPTVRLTSEVSSLAGGLASELGVTKYALVAAALACELAKLAVTDAEHEALKEQSEALLDEIAARKKELERRAKVAKRKKRRL